MSTAALAMIAAGGLITVLATVDLFLTVFNYDGFTFAAGRYQNVCWRIVLAASTLVPHKARQAARSFGSAALLPATVALWLAAQIVGFALIYRAGLVDHGFTLSKSVSRSIGSAFYLSGGAESSLTFGDITPRTGLYRAMVDLQTILGLATFTLALGYVVTTFSVLGDLNALHNSVRRHARQPGRPTSILARHYRGGQASELSDLLETLSDRLESYDEGLRRYPVVYYFHTRRPERSIPQLFMSLGQLLAAIRWGLPCDDPMVDDPWLAALLEQYSATVGRLQRSFVGPEQFEAPDLADLDQFCSAYGQRQVGNGVADFLALQQRTREATGLRPPADDDLPTSYQRYKEWLLFDQRTSTVLNRVALRLGYEPPDLPAVGSDT